MGYLIVPDLKNEFVVCQSPCDHKDCASLRKEWAEAKCTLCGKPMLPGEAFYYDGDSHMHAVCRLEQVEGN